MYDEVARWEFVPKDEPELMALTEKMMDELHAWPGVVSAIDIRVAENAILPVITYADEATYQSLIQDPNGPFEMAAQEHKLERITTWVWSERGQFL